MRTARGGHAFDSSFRTCHSEDARRSSAFGARPIGAIDSPDADRDGAIDPQDMPRRIAAWASRARNGQPVAADIMAERELWNALPPAVQDYAFADLDRHPALVFKGAEVFECGGQSHRVGLFRVPALADAVFVAIPGGRYMFQGNIPDVIPPMLVAQTQTTQRQWKAVPCGVERTPGFQGDDLPMESISWLDIQEWLKAAREKVGLPLDLPHESQWEYACRAGTKTAWCFGDDAAQLDQWAWYSGNSGGRTHPVGQLRPNAFGLYDMHGNVWEWCANEWSRDPVPFVAWEGEQRPDPTGSYGAAEAGSTTPTSRARPTAWGAMSVGATTTSASAQQSPSEGEKRPDPPSAWLVAAAGSTPPPTRARRTATGTLPGGATSTSAFVSPSRLEGEKRPDPQGARSAAAAGSTRPPTRAHHSASGLTSASGASTTSAFASRSRLEGEGQPGFLGRAWRGAAWLIVAVYAHSSHRGWSFADKPINLLGLRHAIDMRDLT